MLSGVVLGAKGDGAVGKVVGAAAPEVEAIYGKIGRISGFVG